MAPRKRTHDSMSAENQPNGNAVEPPSLISRVRNTWHFACLMQYIQTFGNALKIDDELDIETLEDECVKPGSSQRLADLGLTLLKWISSHRGLTHDIFDEYVRRQYAAKAPERNPYGTEDEPKHFADFDVFTKLRVLHQLSVWTFNNPDRIRERMEEKDNQQTQWRIEPFGFDARGRSYYVLDDFRLYRLMDPPPPIVTPKKSKSKAKAKQKPKTSASRRTSKRQKLSNGDVSGDEAVEDEQDDQEEQGDIETAANDDDGLGGASWELLAISLEEFLTFLDGIKKSKNADEKELHAALLQDIVPKLEKEVEAKERKQAKRTRELQALEKLATAKRSSRLAGKQEKQKEIEEAQATERKKQEELAMAHAEQRRQQKLEQDRESRMMTREQRLKDREVKRILHEEELAKLERGESVDSESNRISERNRKTVLEKKQKDIEALKLEIAESSTEWYFDCSICGKHGRNYDDGEHSMACERCNVWEHSKCHGITEQEAEQSDFHFFCNSCTKLKSMKLNFSKSVASSNVTVNSHAGPMGQSGRPAVVFKGQSSNGYPPKQLFNTTKPAAAQAPSIFGRQPSPTRPDPHLRHSQGHAQPRPYNMSPNVYPPSQHSPQAYPPHGHPQTSPYQHNPQHYPPNVSYTHPHQHPFTNSSAVYEQRQLSSTQQHNPFLNRFDRQAPPTQTHSRPTSSYSNNANSSPPANPLAKSPTPSLSATQGSTDVRFSPKQPVSSFSSNISSAPHLAYTPTTNLPTASAYSPRKQTSPSAYPSPWPSHTSQHPQMQSTHHHHGQQQYKPNGIATTPNPPQVPSPHASALGSSPRFLATSSAAGISPIKHDQAAPTLSPPNLHVTGSQSSAPRATQATPAKSMPDTMPPAPALSPSVNIDADSKSAANGLPVKKPVRVPEARISDIGLHGAEP